MGLRDELLAEVGPKTHVADLCGRAVDGWTWFGFETEEMMERFLAAWPEPVADGPVQ